jgi:hypothetical protein
VGSRRLPAIRMHVSMPPDTPPPDDARGPEPGEPGNVVDPEVLAERRAQRAEQAEHSAARRAADAQVLAAQLARERAQLAAERDAARAEAAAAREGADAAIAEAAHVAAERDTLREALAQAHAERDALQAERQAAAAPAPVAAAVAEARAPGNNGATNGDEPAPPVAWRTALRRELAAARAAAAAPPPAATEEADPLEPVPGLARERRLVARRATAPPGGGAAAALRGRRSDRAAPVTALALERERSSRLQAQLANSISVQRELRLQIAALERAVRERLEAEQRIEAALRRVREELDAARALDAAQPVADAGPASDAAAATDPPPAADAQPAVAPLRVAARLLLPPPAAAAVAAGQHATASEPTGAVAPDDAPQGGVGLDPSRLLAARERLRAAAPAGTRAVEPLRDGPAAPWLAPALQRLLERDADLAGRLTVGLLPAYARLAERPLRCDLELAAHGVVAVDLATGAATVATRTAPRGRSETDLRIAADHAGLARLLHGRRRLLRRPARVRGSRRALRDLRRLARATYGIRDLADAGVALTPALALRLVALAIAPGATAGERFAVAHAPLAGGPVDAWLRIADGAEPAVLDTAPPEPVRLMLRCTRGALLPLIAGSEPPPGESGAIEGDEAALALLRGWIAATEHTAV